MKNVLKAVSYVDGKHSTIVYSAFFFLLLLLHACISLKFQSAGSEKSDTITKAVQALKSD